MTDYRKRVVEIASSLIGRDHTCCTDAAPGYDLSRVSWCQIFWLHCLREAGLTERTWGDLERSGWVDGWLPRTGDPQPGDLAYIDQPKQHGAVVEDVIPNIVPDMSAVDTIDGNSVGRAVCARSRMRHDFTSFYSIQPLIDAMRDTVPPPPSSRRGVDVSAHQPPASVNWQQLRELGFDFAWIRGVKMGRELDSAAVEHVARARCAKFSVGLYAFFDPRHPVELQAQLMRDAHAACGIRPGDLAPVLDIESITNGPHASPAWVEPCCELLQGYVTRWGAAVRYHNVADWFALGRPPELEQYPLWLADYSPPADLECCVWQHRSKPIHGYGTAPMDQNVVVTELPRIGHPRVEEG